MKKRIDLNSDMRENLSNGALPEKSPPLAPWRAFFRELISNPRHIGAACPSSRGLARCMASFVPQTPWGLVVELGAGTGVVTAALLERGIPSGRIVPVERSPELARFLHDRFPNLTVLCGDAGHLDQLLKEKFGGQPHPVECVVSSLPLRSLPRPGLDAIMAQLDLLLGDQGRYIQFTYDLRSETPCLLPGFTRVDSRVIWLNIPPARADLFRRKPVADR